MRPHPLEASTYHCNLHQKNEESWSVFRWVMRACKVYVLHCLAPKITSYDVNAYGLYQTQTHYIWNFPFGTVTKCSRPKLNQHTLTWLPHEIKKTYLLNNQKPLWFLVIKITVAFTWNCLTSDRYNRYFIKWPANFQWHLLKWISHRIHSGFSK